VEVSGTLASPFLPADHIMVSLSSTHKPARFSRSFLFRIAIAGVFVLSSIWFLFGGFTKSFSSLPRFVLGDEVGANPLKLQSIPLVHKNVVVASAFPWHYDIYMPVAWTLGQIMLKDQGTLQVYAPMPFAFGYQEVMDQYGVYGGEIKSDNDLLRDIKSGGNDGGIDLVILGTCEIEYVFRLLVPRKLSQCLFSISQYAILEQGAPCCMGRSRCCT